MWTWVSDLASLNLHSILDEGENDETDVKGYSEVPRMGRSLHQVGAQKMASAVIAKVDEKGGGGKEKKSKLCLGEA